MLRANIKYNDFNDEEVEMTAYFNLNKMEMKRYVGRFPNGIEAFIADMKDNGTAGDLLEFIEDLIQTAYGVRSEDGKRFSKSPELLQDFKDSGAYDEYVFGLTNEIVDFAKFLLAIFPSDQRESLLTSMTNDMKELAEEAETEEEREAARKEVETFLEAIQ